MLDQHGQSDKIGVLCIKAVHINKQSIINYPLVTEFPGLYGFRFEFLVLIGCWFLTGSLGISKTRRIIGILSSR